jgi:hypothetical protein
MKVAIEASEGQLSCELMLGLWWKLVNAEMESGKAAEMGPETDADATAVVAAGDKQLDH